MNFVFVIFNVWQNLIKAIIILVVLQGCVTEKKDVNRFFLSSDTLIIETNKQRGSGLHLLGVGQSYFQDTSENFTYPIVYPLGIDSVQRMHYPTDFTAEKKYYIDVIKGKMNGDQVFIVDQNNNHDLSDDSVRVYQAIKWYSEDHLIKCKYTIDKYHKAHEDSTWLRMGVIHGDLWSGYSEHLIGDFEIDNDVFEIGLVSSRTGDLTYKTLPYPGDILITPELALFSENTSRKDTLYKRDILSRGEALKLNNAYYRYDSISYFGDTLILVKEKSFHQKIGTQVGMIAPEFKFASVSGDTIESSSLNDKPIVIANSCGCGGDTLSTEAFFDMTEVFGDKINIVRMDDRIKKGQEGFHIDISNDFNKDIYKTYRKEYCSRTCYVIDKTRLVDKFEVTDWKQFLSSIVFHKD